MCLRKPQMYSPLNSTSLDRCNGGREKSAFDIRWPIFFWSSAAGSSRFSFSLGIDKLNRLEGAVVFVDGAQKLLKVLVFTHCNNFRCFLEREERQLADVRCALKFLKIFLVVRRRWAFLAPATFSKFWKGFGFGGENSHADLVFFDPVVRSREGEPQLVGDTDGESV